MISRGQNSFPMPDSEPPLRYFRPWLWSVPAVTLTYASVLVFAVVYAYIMGREVTRGVFFLPYFDRDLLGVPAVFFGSLLVAAMVGGLIMKMRNRPQIMVAKIWLLILLLSSIAGVVFSLYFWRSETNGPFLTIPASVWAHTTLFATLCALAVLLFRFYKPLPDSKWIQRAAPVAVLIVVPLLFLFVHLSYVSTNKFASDYIDERKLKLKEFAENPTIAAVEDVREAEKELEVMISNARIVDPELQKLKEEVMQRIQSLIADLTPEKLEPYTVTYNQQPVIKYDFQNHDYIFDPVTARKYSENVKRFEFINSSLSDLRQTDSAEFEKESDLIKSKLDAVIDNWADRWLVFQLPEVYGNTSFDKSEYSRDLIERSFLTLRNSRGQEVSFTLGSMEDLLRTRIDVESVSDYARRSGCYEGEPFRSRSGRTYFGVVCQAYIADDDQNIVTVLSLRIIYDMRGGPSEIAIIIPQYREQPARAVNLDRTDFVKMLRNAPNNATNAVRITSVERAKKYYLDNEMYYTRVTLR